MNIQQHYMIHKQLLNNMPLYYTVTTKEHRIIFYYQQFNCSYISWKKQGKTKKARESRSIDLDHRTTIWWIYVLFLLLRRPIKLFVTILTPLVESGIITFTIDIQQYTNFFFFRDFFFLTFFRNKFLIPLMGSGNFFLGFLRFFFYGCFFFSFLVLRDIFTLLLS